MYPRKAIFIKYYVHVCMYVCKKRKKLLSNTVGRDFMRSQRRDLVGAEESVSPSLIKVK